MKEEDILNLEASQSAIKALLYFDIFNYPLTRHEIFANLSTNHISSDQLDLVLNALCENGVLYKTNKFYSLQHDNGNTQRRIRGNESAENVFPFAQRRARLIMSFPFISAVYASGSLSKNYMDEESDLDFFVVTAPGRLWIARTILVLFKRFFLLNSHKAFCVNYFISRRHLEIAEKNIYTAVEMATLKLLAFENDAPGLHEANKWVRDFLPNHTDSFADERCRVTRKFWSRAMDFVLDRLGGDWLDILLMRLTLRRWKKLYGARFDGKDFQVAFKTERHVSKNHPRFYQKSVVTAYQEKVKEFGQRFNIQWLHE